MPMPSPMPLSSVIGPLSTEADCRSGMVNSGVTQVSSSIGEEVKWGGAHLPYMKWEAAVLEVCQGRHYAGQRKRIRMKPVVLGPPVGTLYSILL